jgi:hypothetical protein
MTLETMKEFSGRCGFDTALQAIWRKSIEID